MFGNLFSRGPKEVLDTEGWRRKRNREGMHVYVCVCVFVSVCVFEWLLMIVIERCMMILLLSLHLPI